MADWLKPFVEKLGHKKRRQMCPLYVAGLIGPGERKSIEPIVVRMAPDRYDRLHHFISDGLRDGAPIEAELAKQADRLIGDPNAFLVIGDTSLPKKGEHLVGVAPQYASMLGKRANCQTLRMTRAGVPEAFRQPRSKPEIALEEIDRLRACAPAPFLPTPATACHTISLSE